MIFPSEHVHLIRGGRVSQTRRPATSLDGWPATVDDLAVERVKPAVFGPGRVYSVQRSRRMPGEFRIIALEVVLQQLADVSDQDARREGFKHAIAWRRAWIKAHGDFDPRRVVWAITFELLADEVRLLARRGGYTDKRHLALTDEPEAVGEVTQSEISDGFLHVEDQAGRLEVVRGVRRAQTPAAKRATRKVGLHDLAEDVLRGRLPRHEGLSPEEVHAVDPAQGTPGEVRQRRRLMGLRGVDGLTARSELELDATLASLVARGASVRTVAYVMDWSHGKAQRYLADVKELAA